MRTILTLLLTLAPVVALAQPVDPFQHQDAYVAPGRPIFNGDISCTKSGTTFLKFDQGQTGDAANFLVPDGSRVVITSLLTSSSTNTAKCALLDSPAATIGYPFGAANNDILDVTGAPNGTSLQGGLLLIPAGQTRVMRASYLLSLGAGGARSGLCSAPVIGSAATDAQSYTAATDRVRMDGLDVYASCKCNSGASADASGSCASSECSAVAGTPSGATCLVTQAARSAELVASKRGGAQQTVRGQHLGCRCSVAQTLHAEVVR